MTNQRPVHKTIALFLAASASAILVGCATDETPPSAPREQKIAARRAEHMERGKQLFAELDADQSGSLSAKELDAATGPATMLKLHLAEIDADRDGQLTHDELETAMRERHAAHDDHHARVVAQFDTDGDGELDATEREAAHRYMFDQADTDDSGTLSSAELAATPGPGPMLARHFAEIDGNGDGALGYEEITTAIEAHHRHHR